MRTDELIRQLAADATPVRPLRPLAVRIVGWLALAAASLVVVMGLMGVRRVLGDALDRADFTFEALLLVVTAVSGASGALIISVPGAERSRLVRWLPIIAGAGCVVWAAGELAFAAAMGASTGRLTFAWHCVYKTTSIAAVPGVALFLMVRRAAPMHARWAGALALLATSAVGVLGANIICPTDRPVHMLLWHVTPLILFASLGAWLGARFLRWPRPGRPGRAGDQVVVPSDNPWAK